MTQHDRGPWHRLAGARSWGRTRADWVLRVPLARRLLSEMVRVEVVDRSMAVAAQALLALVPLLVVAAAFLPPSLIEAGLDRFQAVTGVADTQVALLQRGVDAGTSADDLRSQIGIVGAVVTLFSASSFSRAVQRAYEKVWDQQHLGGMVGRARSLGWLLAWLAGLEVLAAASSIVGRSSRPAVDALGLAARGALTGLLWWWSLHYLLSGRVRWAALVPASAITGAALVAYADASTLVMPSYAASSAAEFGVLGLVLTVATWLVGLAGVLVASAIVGRVLADDRWVLEVARRLVDGARRTRGRRGRRSEAQPRAG